MSGTDPSCPKMLAEVCSDVLQQLVEASVEQVDEREAGGRFQQHYGEE